MKTNMEGFEIECTVEEFIQLMNISKNKEHVTPMEEIENLKQWPLIEYETYLDGDMQVTSQWKGGF